jgi:hypothetical protein
MTHLLSMAVLLMMVAPQNQNLPDEFHRIPEQLRDSATIIIAGTYGEGRTPCQWRPDGSREWFKDSWFEVKRVYRGKVSSKSIGINTAMLPVNRYVSERLEEARDYLVLLRPGEDKLERIKTGKGLSFWDALHGDEIIAIVKLASDAHGGDTLRTSAYSRTLLEVDRNPMTNNSNNGARHGHCSICSQLGDHEFGRQTHGRPEEDTFLPDAARRLENIREIKPGSVRYIWLRQCPECATYYLHRTGYEYLASGSEDEQFLTRLTDEQAAEYLAQPLPD